jgi:8-oxo-dGTP diphosphatase
MGDFHGAKLALLNGDSVLTYLRDDFAHLPFPAHWDLPGGGREGPESPEDCVLRELDEEFGLVMPPERLIWKRLFNWTHRPEHRVWFFGGLISTAEIAAIRFGDEGQYWEMMPIAAFLSHERAISDLQFRLSLWLDDSRPAQ